MTPKPLSLETERDHEQWKVVVCFLIRWIYRTWMACVLLLGLFTALWALETMDIITYDTLGAIWVAIVAVGLAFLAFLIPAFLVIQRGS